MLQRLDPTPPQMPRKTLISKTPEPHQAARTSQKSPSALEPRKSQKQRFVQNRCSSALDAAIFWGGDSLVRELRHTEPQLLQELLYDEETIATHDIDADDDYDYDDADDAYSDADGDDDSGQEEDLEDAVQDTPPNHTLDEQGVRHESQAEGIIGDFVKREPAKQTSTAFARHQHSIRSTMMTQRTSSLSFHPGRPLAQDFAAIINATFKHKSAVEEIRREMLYARLMRVITVYWKDRKHPDWSRPALSSVLPRCWQIVQSKKISLLLRSEVDHLLYEKKPISGVRRWAADSASDRSERAANFWEEYLQRNHEEFVAKPRDGRAVIKKVDGPWATSISTPRSRMIARPPDAIVDLLPTPRGQFQPPSRKQVKLTLKKVRTKDISEQGELPLGMGNPMLEYLHICTREGIRPLTIGFVTGHSKKLDMSGLVPHDSDLYPIISMIQRSGQVEEVDFTG